MSSYAFFLQTFWEEHKKNHPDASINYSEFSKKCSEKWMIMSVKDKKNIEDMAKTDRAHSERNEMKWKLKTHLKGKQKRS